MMLLEEICERLSQRGHYSAELSDGILKIRDLETNSEYVVEAFEQSAQIRQAVWFDFQDFSEDDLRRVYVLCSMMNERFSGCKCCIDQWGALITVADILGPNIAMEFIETMLGQVEFVSQAMLDLVEISRNERRPVTEEEMDSALDVPPLQ